MPRKSRARDRQRRHERLLRKLAGERVEDVIDAVGHGIRITDGELRAVFRGGHLRKFEAFETTIYSMEDLRKIDDKLGLPRRGESSTL